MPVKFNTSASPTYHTPPTSAADGPLPDSPMLSGEQKRALVSAEVERLNRVYGACVRVVFSDMGEVGVENSSARYNDFLMRVDMDAPLSHYRGEALFIARHEFGHAAFRLDELEADRFAAEWAALQGQPRDEMALSIAATPADDAHLSGPERVRRCRAIFDQTRRAGAGLLAPVMPPRPPLMPDT